MTEVEIEHEEKNDLLNRREMTVRVNHDGEATPTRGTMTDEIAKLANVSKQNIIVAKIETEFGKEESVVQARIYDDAESLDKYEREYFKERG